MVILAERNISEITPEILSLSSLCQENNNIETELYSQYDVKRGLRDVNGKGVLAGLTHISEIKSSKIFAIILKVTLEKNNYPQ